MARFIGVLPSASRNADITSKVFRNDEGCFEALHVVVDITAGSPNLLVAVKGVDNASEKTYTLLTSAAINSGTTVLKVGPAYTATTNVAKDYIPYAFEVVVTQSGAVAATYSIGASLI